MSSGTSVKFDASHLVVVVLPGSHPSLATRKDDTVEVARVRCQYCSSKLSLSFDPCEHGSLQQRICNNRNLVTATS